MPRLSTVLSRVLVSLSTIVVSLVLLLPSAGRATDVEPDPPLVNYVVRPGDTLWAIASGLESDADVRDTVARIMSLNDLSSSAIVPGQHLVVPSDDD